MPGRRPSRLLAAGGILLVVAVAAGVTASALGVPLPFGQAAGAAGPVPRFVDETQAAGLAFTYDGDLQYSVGAGVAVLDCNADGRPDLYLAGGERPAGLFRNDSVPGALRFSRVGDQATDLAGVTGAYPIDVDGDGIVDLAVLRIGENVILRGLGDCRFERANEAWNLDGGRFHTMAFSASWERGNTWPTIAFGNYQDETIDDPERWCEPNQLVRPAGPGARSWGSPAPLEPGWCTLSMLFSSWDGSGRMDLRVSNDRHYYPIGRGQEQLWRMDPGQPPRPYAAADGWTDVQIEGMGIASYDLTGDGLPEVYLTSQAANRLMTLADGPTQPRYVDIGLARGTNVPHPVLGEDQAFPSTSWHPEFADVNDDGLVDLFVSKGNISQQPDFAREDPSHLLLGRPDGTFAEATEAAGLVRFDRGRGAALVDLDLDGRLDVVEGFYGAPVHVWRNAGPSSGDPGDRTSSHWLAVRLRDAGPNVDAIGALVEVNAGARTFRREVTIGGGHAGGQLGWIHVGLGAADRASVRVRWPDGTWTQPIAVGADQFGTIDRAAGAFQPWTDPVR